MRAVIFALFWYLWYLCSVSSIYSSYSGILPSKDEALPCCPWVLKNLIPVALSPFHKGVILMDKGQVATPNHESVQEWGTNFSTNSKYHGDSLQSLEEDSLNDPREMRVERRSESNGSSDRIWNGCSMVRPYSWQGLRSSTRPLTHQIREMLTTWLLWWEEKEGEWACTIDQGEEVTLSCKKMEGRVSQGGKEDRFLLLSAAVPTLAGAKCQLDGGWALCLISFLEIEDSIQEKAHTCTAPRRKGRAFC